ncbi:MAG: phosphatidylinositol mannoside acyltransferase [Frankiales bacterium]|nr:phosphatidylinositol mannoside acyltransferase [Frankiales bacterium]
MTLTDRVTDVGYQAAWRFVRAIPEPVAQRVFQLAADRSTRKDGRGVQQLRRNLKRVVGTESSDAEVDALVRDGMRSYARYWLETFRLPSMDIDDTLARTHAVGTEHIHRAASHGRGVILALPHSGNWEVAGIWLVDQGFPFTTVAERLKPESLFDQFVAYREGLGMQVIPLTGDEQPPAHILRERLKAGGMVCLVAERDLSRSGIEVEFFGERTRMPAGPALLAATTGAALLPVHLYYEQNGWGQTIAPPVDLGEGSLRERVTRGTQALADFFATHIAEHPQDWHMLQRLWLADGANDDANDDAGIVDPAVGS